ncbi:MULTISPECIES: hypothetical protein [Nocardia]|uniref:hypothetical protein n=1 Tax=Nocardia TaxID=1817 RepID=UPI001894B642|nr:MULTISPECIES: hypothetical protein [Nocardia]MBF6351437.1 hypothetical protein [Nocardia flavorosea]
MSGKVSVYIDALEKAANSSGGAGELLGAIASRLRERTAALHGAWGDDRYGEQFAEAYIPARNALAVGEGEKPGALPGLAKVFEDIADAQRDAAKVLRRQEDDNRAGFRGNQG